MRELMGEYSDHVIRSSDVIGLGVIGSDNEELGFIEEIVINKKNGNIVYAVLSFKCFMGIGHDYYALPWKTLSYNYEHEVFNVNLTKEMLKSEKGFSKSNWPDYANHSCYNYGPLRRLVFKYPVIVVGFAVLAGFLFAKHRNTNQL